MGFGSGRGRLTYRKLLLSERGQGFRERSVTFTSIDLVQGLGHGFGEGARVERLRHVVLGAEIERAHAIGQFGPCGDENDGYPVGRSVGQQGGCHFPPGDPGHHDVEEDQIRLFVMNRGERLFAVGRLENPKPRLLETCSAKDAETAVVVDDEYGLPRSFTVRAHALEA